eukprot:TRINITY_DN1691_c0_g1_i1.p1 TRINITY_DN1691_c0_g1~~TRINITY_DN1691_c0_g1_i1.p1  ORF type:complete len:331 (-),score=91.48 TRINITY_DN1691_c0_g1_i1:72-1064(-)
MLASDRDIEIPSSPPDGISSISWSPKANFLVAGCWDSQVRCWDVSNPRNPLPKAAISHEAPILSTSWSGDGSRVFTGGCDNKAKCWSLQTNQIVQIAQHNAPVRTVNWVEEMNALVTGSWDKTVRYWDGRSSNPIHEAAMPERVYALDVKFPLLVACTADRNMIVYDLRKPNVEFKRKISPMKWQTRTVSCFPDKTGFALGSIEGRVAIEYVEEKDSSRNFAFRCHREGNDVYSVNAISFHPIQGTFATAGSDGTFNYWDKDSRHRLKAFSKCPAPISAASFNADGSLFAYAVSYDWSKGAEHYHPQSKNQIMVHITQEGEVKKKGTVKR